MNKEEFKAVQANLKSVKPIIITNAVMEKLLGLSDSMIEKYRSGDRAVNKPSRQLIKLLKYNKKNVQYLMDNPD